MSARRRAEKGNRPDEGVAPAASSKRAHHLVNAKLKPPRIASAWVEREDLRALLDRALCKKLVLLGAPIGSGKTTLLSQWYAHATPARAVAWLSLDEHDNEPVRFFSYLASAVRSTVEDFSAYIASGPHDRADLPLEHVTAVFLESLGAIEEELVIVLDDFQWVSDPSILRAFTSLLHRSGANVHWLIAGRQSPELALSQLRLQDQLLIVGNSELNFSGAEIAQLSCKLYGASLSAEDADYIRVRTEGWIAGVKLALLSASDPANAGEALKRFAGSHCEVADYLVNAVLRDQPPEVRDFLVASSIVDRMNGDLCNSLLGVSNAQALLESLEKSQLFTQALDSHHQWYRYHVLFLDFLRSRLNREAPERVAHLHSAASRWFAEHQMTEEALQHAYAGGDQRWCVELTARCAHAWLRDGEIDDVLRWTQRLSRDEILRHNDIGTAYITSLILSRRFAEAAAALRDAPKPASASADGNGIATARLRVLQLMLSILADTADEADIVEHDALADIDADAFLAGTLLTLQAYRRMRQSQFDVARRLAMRARDVQATANSVYGVGYAEMVVCLADRAQGDMKAATDSCERAYAQIKTGRRNPAWVNAATAVAHLRYQQNRIAEAEALCVEVLPLLSIASTIENFAIAYITFARIKSINARPTEAFQLLDYLHSVLESGGGHRRFLAQVCYEKIRLCLLQKNLDRARAVATEFELPLLAARCEWQEPRAYDEAWERLGFAQAALLLHEQRYGECRALLGVLRDSAHRVGYVYREVPLAAALAACHWHSGQSEAAFDALNRALSLAQGFGFTRSVFDEAPGLQDVIAMALQAKKLRYLLPTKYFERFQDVFAASQHLSAHPEIKRKPALPLEPLTDRELDMLKLLSRGLSNQEISERSQIALSTAKWHLKNVFAKLDVSTRTGAIIRARELQLIE
jgi:LuxR family maltose regulon positive regulatory protein